MHDGTRAVLEHCFASGVSERRSFSLGHCLILQGLPNNCLASPAGVSAAAVVDTGISGPQKLTGVVGHSIPETSLGEAGPSLPSGGRGGPRVGRRGGLAWLGTAAGARTWRGTLGRARGSM